MGVRILWTAFVCLLGTCLGQTSMSCDRMTTCSCEGKSFSRIDIEAELEQTIGDPVKDPNLPYKYQYLLNFCNGRKCDNDSGVGGGVNAVVCEQQIDGKQNVSVKLGDASQYSWQVFNNNTFTIEFAGGDAPDKNGEGSRSAILYVFVTDNPSATFNKVKYVEERISGDNREIHVYVFAVNMTSRYYTESPTTPSPTTPSPTTPSPSVHLTNTELFLILFFSVVGVVAVCVMLICSVCCCLFCCHRRSASGYSTVNGRNYQYT